MRTRAKQSYLLLERLTIVRESIEFGFYPSATVIREKVMDKLGITVSLSTLFRDLNFLRDRCGVNIKYDSYRQGYYIEPAESN